MNNLNIAHGIVFSARTKDGIDIQWRIVKAPPHYEIEAIYNQTIVCSEVEDMDDIQLFFTQIMYKLAGYFEDY